MSTTFPATEAHRSAVEKTAFALALVALVLAVAGLVATVSHMRATGTTSTSAVATGVVATGPAALSDSVAKVSGGVVRPIERMTDAPLTAAAEPSTSDDQQPGHPQSGPMS